MQAPVPLVGFWSDDRRRGVLAHNYLFTGQFLPSALVKAHWATFIPDIVPVISTFSPDL